MCMISSQITDPLNLPNLTAPRCHWFHRLDSCNPMPETRPSAATIDLSDQTTPFTASSRRARKIVDIVGRTN